MQRTLTMAMALMVIAVVSFGYYHNFFLDRSSSFGSNVQQLANVVGVSIGIEENEHNRIAQQLRERADELDDREQSLQELEQEIVEEMAEERRESRVIFLYVSGVAFVLFLLIITNFYYDVVWRKRRDHGDRDL